ncbi:MAG: sigma-70 family RNA polymerase sigma factor [Pirellulaceae bacterium]|nr:sigma-70 family RNA polymerase sigma factor [Pirellulaceae bacterium]
MDETPETSESLIARVKDLADGDAWTEFLAMYRPVVVRLARRRGLQDADAQDVAQKVLLAVSLAIGKWEPRSGQPFRAWLGKIAHNAILNALTRRPPDIGTGLSAVADQLNEVAEDDPDTSEAIVLETRRELFRLALQHIRMEFTPTTWEMFWETEVHGKSVDEVAASLERSPGAVYVARCRVMKRLRDRMQEVSAVWGIDSKVEGN